MTNRLAASLKAEAAFRARLEEHGATLLEPEWLGALTAHRVRCAAGHETTRKPNHLQQGRGVCPACSGRSTKAAESAFRARLVELGLSLVEPGWLGTKAHHGVQCRAGHQFAVTPGHARTVRGEVCPVCSGRDPAAALADFRGRLAAKGARLLEAAWLGVETPHRVRCPEGHECSPRPKDVKKGQGICRTCGRHDPAAAFAAFRERLTGHGAALIEPGWLGSNQPHRARCAAGHLCTPRPNDVARGVGLCARCKYKVWDVFYLVADEGSERLKFGITSGNPRHRLSRHKREGYTTVLRLFLGLPGDAARTLENEVRATLRLTGHSPIRGREYFDGSALRVILDVVDHSPLTRQGQPAAVGG